MGNCCNREVFIDREIEDSRTIQDLALLFKNREEKFELERNQINAHIQDPRKQVDAINIDNLDNETLQKRTIYLQELENAFERVQNKLLQRYALDVEKVKPYLHNISSKYYISYDPNHELDAAVIEFENYISRV